MSSTPVVLRSATQNSQALALELHPQIGGAITRFQLTRPGETLDLLRPTPAQVIAERNVLETSCYPLIPFSNRVKDGRFTFAGREYQLEPNLPGHPHPLHGHGWRCEWDVLEQSEDSVTLAYSRSGADFPSRQSGTQRFKLLPGALQVDLDLRNTGAEAMPAGIGLHPFFPKPADTRLHAQLATVWLGTDDCIPVTRVSVPERWDFSAGRDLGDLALDHCFGGWTGRARVVWPSRGVNLAIEATNVLTHAVIYAPPGQDFFCFEPVSNANDAFNLSARGIDGVGLSVLKPGESLSARVTFTVRSL